MRGCTHVVTGHPRARIRECARAAKGRTMPPQPASCSARALAPVWRARANPNASYCRRTPRTNHMRTGSPAGEEAGAAIGCSTASTVLPYSPASGFDEAKEIVLTKLFWSHLILRNFTQPVPNNRVGYLTRFGSDSCKLVWNHHQSQKAFFQIWPRIEQEQTPPALERRSSATQATL